MRALCAPLGSIEREPRAGRPEPDANQRNGPCRASEPFPMARHEIQGGAEIQQWESR
jgi:hypothetical protein